MNIKKRIECGVFDEGILFEYKVICVMVFLLVDVELLVVLEVDELSLGDIY